VSRGGRKPRHWSRHIDSLGLTETHVLAHIGIAGALNAPRSTERTEVRRMRDEQSSARQPGDAHDQGSTGTTGKIETDGLRADPMVAVYRHDVHKLQSRRHDAAKSEEYGVPVNETVPLGADRDAALMSRPRGDPDVTVENHVAPYRLSLLTGQAATSVEVAESYVDGGLPALIRPDDAVELHARWLTSPIPAVFNETAYYPYTSLKYHVMLAGTLLDNYRAGHEFADLWLVASRPEETVASADGAITADSIEPYRTVLWTPSIALHVTADPSGRPATRLGAEPARSFADAWSRLPVHPLVADGDDEGRDGDTRGATTRRWQVLDAQLRRIRSWSTGLQYIADYTGEDPGGPGDAPVLNGGGFREW
jgi:hypothetical protein